MVSICRTTPLPKFRVVEMQAKFNSSESSRLLAAPRTSPHRTPSASEWGSFLEPRQARLLHGAVLGLDDGDVLGSLSLIRALDGGALLKIFQRVHGIFELVIGTAEQE